MAANPNNAKPKKGSKSVTRTGKWKKIFLRAIVQGGSIMGACQLAHVHYATYRRHYLDDPEFKAEMDIALEQYDDLLEAELHRRGVVGWEEPVYGSGGPGVGTVKVGTIRKFSDACLFGRLKARMPGKYKDNAQVQQTNTNNTLVMDWDDFLRMTQMKDPPKQIPHTENGQSNGVSQQPPNSP